MLASERRLGNVEAAMKCFEGALEACLFSPCHKTLPCCLEDQVDGKMNLANKNLGAIYGSMGRMVLSPTLQIARARLPNQ